MDMNNPEYIKMILALPDEFYDGWEWKEGDHYIHIFPYGTMTDNYIGIIECWNAVYNPHTFPQEFRPIPSQEQLQKISKLDWDLYYHDLVKRYSDYDTAEQAGLAMIMYTKYGKRWDGEAWVKI